MFQKTFWWVSGKCVNSYHVLKLHVYWGLFRRHGSSLAWVICERSHVLLVCKNCSRNSNCQVDLVALWFKLRGTSCFGVFPCCLSSCFAFRFSIVITSLGEEGAGLCASRAFVCFVRVSFCHFSLPLGVGGWLRFVIVALPGLFC